MAVQKEPAKSRGVLDRWHIGHGRLAERFHDGQCFRLDSWANSVLTLPEDATHFGFVFAGEAELAGKSGRFDARAGMYFAQPGEGSVGGDGSGIVVSQSSYRGLFLLGGPIEDEGRLQYIDGCSDTLLIPPVVLGDACLNLLYLPPFTRQTAHTHPSFRAGVIVAGHGVCQTSYESVPLEPGTVFLIEEEGLHSFHTQEEPLVVIAFHPDSDFGPRHDDHPMVNRTIVNGVSAANLSLEERRIDPRLR